MAKSLMRQWDEDPHAPPYSAWLEIRVGQLEAQLAEARKQSEEHNRMVRQEIERLRAEVNRLRAKLGWVPALFDIHKFGLEGK